MLLVHLFVYFARIDLCPFSLPLGVRDWPRLVTVALKDFSINFFLIEQTIIDITDTN